MSARGPRYPIFIPSKGRAATPLTIRALQRLGVPFQVVVEPQEAEAYARVVPEAQILVLPFRDRGLVPTRNWIWDHAEGLGVERFWTMDDNIAGFYRLNRNLKVPCATGAIFAAAEDFVERFENVPVAGFHYHMFASRKTVLPPFELNTRVYSNMLIQTRVRDALGRPYRNRGIYNDDTDLCLRLLKDGWCTILFLAFLAYKTTTMKLKGGMTSFYKGGKAVETADGALAVARGDGRLAMAQELLRRHPDVTKITWKWGRWQHHVDYRRFKANRLRLRPGVTIPAGVDNYGMELQIDEGGGA